VDEHEVEHLLLTLSQVGADHVLDGRPDLQPLRSELGIDPAIGGDRRPGRLAPSIRYLVEREILPQAAAQVGH
jgi:hypothetical protein